MKKQILTTVGAIAIIALMVFNTQFNTKENNSGFTLSSLVMQAFADGESGVTYCYTFYPSQWWNLTDCGNGYDEGTEGGTAACFNGNAGSCEEGDWYYVYSCNGTIVGYGTNTISCR
ncbi:MAG TPA: hypothetical protein DHV48_10465 [Prolixibacteraceae bacterium]|nr:hypothetical protein [Prolixibacteraceae bacterium]